MKPIVTDDLVSLSNLSKLSELKGVVLDNFLNDVVDHVLQRGPGMKSHVVYKENEFGLIEELIVTLKSFIVKHYQIESKETLRDKIKSLALSSEVSKLLYVLMLSRRSEIDKFMKETSIRLASNTLQDFDWKIHVVVSSDKFSKLQEPFLLLILYIVDENNSKREMLIELSRSELDDLLSNFATIQKILSKYA